MSESTSHGTKLGLDRRQFAFTSAGLLVAAAGTAHAAGKGAAPPPAAVPIAGKAPPLELPPLPYAENALAPHISANTLSFHYGKHHRGYVDTVNKALPGTDLVGKSLEDIIRATVGNQDRVAIFNAAAQTWNHTFYWKSMKPGGGGQPVGALKDRIAADFGSFDAFAKDFAAAATSQFGSGWAWLIEDGGKLKVIKTANADTPLALGKKALLTCDVWEHAYYLDYQNKRADYVKAFFEHLANWDFAAENLARKA